MNIREFLLFGGSKIMYDLNGDKDPELMSADQRNLMGVWQNK